MWYGGTSTLVRWRQQTTIVQRKASGNLQRNRTSRPERKRAEMTHDVANVSSDELLRRIRTAGTDSASVRSELEQLRSRGFTEAELSREADKGVPTHFQSPIIAELPASDFPRAGLLMVAGTILLLIGLYLLILSPSSNGEVVNLQRLYIGQTLTIVGAIFFAAGCRPVIKN